MGMSANIFQPSFTFVGKVSILNYSAEPVRCSTRVGSTLKYQTRLERLDRDKHSSLLLELTGLHHPPDGVTNLKYKL
jgi:hypothetical protein